MEGTWRRIEELESAAKSQALLVCPRLQSWTCPTLAVLLALRLGKLSTIT
jgi:hypothetical protein